MAALFILCPMEYNKQAKTIDEQIALLTSRGMLFEDNEYAKNILSKISYYRLRAYWLTFEKENVTPDSHFFKANTYFEQVVKTYEFDRNLRHLVFNSIEKIEIALRTQMIYCVTNNTQDITWYTKTQYFEKVYHFNNLMDLFDKEYQDSKEVFIEHFKSKYNDSPYPPAWMGLEILSYGQLSKLFSNLKREYGKYDIANYFGVPLRLLLSWFEALTYYRNVCAHHGRLWNRKSPKAPMYPNKPKPNKPPIFKWLDFEPAEDKKDRLYGSLAIIYLLLKPLNYHEEYKKELFDLINLYNFLPLHYIGFPEKWEEDSFWSSDNV